MRGRFGRNLKAIHQSEEKLLIFELILVRIARAVPLFIVETRAVAAVDVQTVYHQGLGRRPATHAKWERWRERPRSLL